MEWPLAFISEDDFINHIKATIEKYGDKLESFDLVRFNKNIVDPIKMIFDKMVYHTDWDELVGNEIFRQRDKAANNDIGYFHQRMFQYINNCHVPDNGKEGGWDVIYRNESGIALPNGDCVKTVYVEMKNKHNTMNSAAAGKTYIKMQNQLLRDDDCACFLVEAIAKKSQNITWETTVDGNSVSHKRIRRVSIDKFYEIVTGDEDAFYKMCLILPITLQKILSDGKDIKIPNDTVYESLEKMANLFPGERDMSMALSVYMLGFSSYNGFRDLVEYKEDDDSMMRRMLEYAKWLTK